MIARQNPDVAPVLPLQSRRHPRPSFCTSQERPLCYSSCPNVPGELQPFCPATSSRAVRVEYHWPTYTQLDEFNVIGPLSATLYVMIATVCTIT